MKNIEKLNKNTLIATLFSFVCLTAIHWMSLQKVLIAPEVNAIFLSLLYFSFRFSAQEEKSLFTRVRFTALLSAAVLSLSAARHCAYLSSNMTLLLSAMIMMGFGVFSEPSSK